MLAQLVEQRTFNPFVVGSTPAHPTKISNKNKHLGENLGAFFISAVRRCQNIARIFSDALLLPECHRLRVASFTARFTRLFTHVNAVKVACATSVVDC